MLFPEPGSLLWKEHSLVRPPSLAPSFSLVKLRVTLEQPSVPFFLKKKIVTSMQNASEDFLHSLINALPDLCRCGNILSCLHSAHDRG